MEDIKIVGTVSPEYAKVKEAFKKYFVNGHDHNSQLCVFVGDECVIDLYGNTSQKPYDADSIGIVFSSGKSVAAILMAIMAGHGYLHFKEPICRYWPEFAKNGKDTLTIADLMRHEAGL